MPVKAQSLVPAPLYPGDTLAVIAPAGQCRDSAAFQSGIGILQEMGFQVKWPRDLWPGTGFLADSDQNRANELHQMLCDPEVKGLIALRGGYGCLRLLPYIDFSLFRQYPKILVGFSDLTILLNQVVTQAHLLCLHGPTVSTLGQSTPSSLHRLFSCLSGRWQAGISPPGLELIRASNRAVTGVLRGGNLASLVSLLGTPYDFSWQNSVILLEDIHEPLYRLDRFFTQLSLAGKLQSAAGILLGDFSLENDQERLHKIRYTEQIWNRLGEILAETEVPVWGGIESGHCSENCTLPLGALVTMDSGLGRLIVH